MKGLKVKTNLTGFRRNISLPRHAVPDGVGDRHMHVVGPVKRLSVSRNIVVQPSFFAKDSAARRRSASAFSYRSSPPWPACGAPLTVYGIHQASASSQDADVVMFVYRDEYYIGQREPKIIGFDNEERFQTAYAKWQSDMDQLHNIAELIIAKQRHGPIGRIRLFFEAEFTRFADLDPVHTGE